MSSRPLTFKELQSEAKRRSFLAIASDGQFAWYPLEACNGHPGDVIYFLIGNKILVKNELGDDVCWYTLG